MLPKESEFPEFPEVMQIQMDNALDLIKDSLNHTEDDVWHEMRRVSPAVGDSKYAERHGIKIDPVVFLGWLKQVLYFMRQLPS